MGNTEGVHFTSQISPKPKTLFQGIVFTNTMRVFLYIEFLRIKTNAMRTILGLLMVWFTFSSSHPVKKSDKHLDSFAFMYGKWRGKGWYLKNDVKEFFDITQWVKNDKKQHLNIYGYSQKATYKAQSVDFSKSIVWDSIGQKPNINFYFKDNFLVITPISTSNGNDWCFQFDDDYGQSYRFTWQTNKDNLWVETGEFLSNGVWMPFCKSALEKQ